MSAPRRALYYLALAAVASLALASIPALREAPLAVPITHRLDGLFLAILAKTIGEGGFLHAARIGAPFGADLVDWPIGMWLPFVQMAVLSRVTGEPGLALNLYWMSTIVVAAMCAAYALRRLRVAPVPAFTFGILYAFQPYVFYRNVEHVNLTFPFVPLVALAILRVAGVHSEDQTPHERTLTLVGCVAQGLSYVYYSAFACLLLAVAAPLGALRRKSLRPLAHAALAGAALVGSTAATVAPTLVYWHRHGYNPDLDYKPPAETEVYALKLRHLLTPISDHPVPALRAVAVRLDTVPFPAENENAFSRLGSVGSLGLLGLLLFLFARAAGLLPRRDDPLEAASALSLATLLWASVGGLATFWNVFVLPDVRAYNRIVVFLSFFCVLAAGTLAQRLARRLPLPERLRPAAAVASAAALLVVGLVDQIPAQHLSRMRQGSWEAFQEERGLVRAIEERLPAGAMVFQLPHMTIPVDRATHSPMLYYDPGRAFLHSRTLRWSWGAMIGRQRDWGRAVDSLPVAERLRVVTLAGFAGIWIDRWGFTGAERPRYQTIESEIAAITGTPLQASTAGRYSFVSLQTYRERLSSQLGAERLERLQAEVVRDMPILGWRSGCGEEEREGAGWWRSCGPDAGLEVRNFRPGPLDVTFRARLRSAQPGTLRIIGPGILEELPLSSTPVEIERGPLRVPGLQHTVIGLAFRGPCSPASRCFDVGEARLTTRRIVRGRPVNEDGGTMTRTRH